MPQLDRFLSALVTNGAGALMLQGDDVALFDIGGVSRPVTKQPISAAQLVALLKEIAPVQFHAAITAGQDAAFHYRSADGAFAVRVGVKAGRMVASLRPDVSNMSGATAEQAVAAEPAPASVQVHVNSEAAPAEGSHRAQIDLLLKHQVDEGASDLHLRVGEPPILRKDGEMRRVKGHQPMENDQLEAMLRSIMPPRNRQEFEELNDTDFAYEIPGVARFRCNALRDHKGAGGVFRVIPARVVTVDQLGLSPEVQALAALTRGLVLVTGPTGCGKSTTLGALVDLCNRTRSDHLITIEDPIEFVHTNIKCIITQRQVGTHTSSFKHALRAALREDPDIVLVGELRDLETVSIAIETAETGHLVFGTLHTTSAASTIDRLIDQFPTDAQEQIRVMLSESLRGVISQTLCKKIGGGRVAAREILLTVPSISNLIREGKTFQITSTMQTSKKIGMVILNDALMDLVDARQVAPQEAYIKANDKTGFANALRAKGHDTSFLDATEPAAPPAKPPARAHR